MEHWLLYTTDREHGGKLILGISLLPMMPGLITGRLMKMKMSVITEFHLWNNGKMKSGYTHEKDF